MSLATLSPNRRWAALALLLAAALAGCREKPAREREPAPLTISAASSLRDALEAVAREYRALHPGARLRFNFASSGTLQQQIQRGAPVDVFVSAADAQVDALQRSGLVAPGTRRVVAGNELVLVVPAGAEGAVSGFRDLAFPAVRRVAIGMPATVPAGRYAEELLRSLGIHEPVLARAVRAQHVRQVLTYVELGEVDAGIVYRTDARRSDRVRVVAAAPPGSHAPITYPAVVVAGTAQPAEARAFLDFLAGPVAQRVLQRHGFRPPR